MYEITFALSPDASLYIPVLIPEHEQHVRSAGSIFLRRTSYDDVLLAADRPLLCAIDELFYELQDLFENKLEAGPTLKEKGVGYMYNEHLFHRHDDVKLPQENYSVGFIWKEPETQVITRLYTIDGKIFLDISPYYPWTSFDEEEMNEMRLRDDYVPYDEYMKDYKPVAILEIPREIARQWLEKSERLVKTMYYNYETFKLYPQSGEQSMYNSIAWPNDMYTRFGTSEGEIVELRAIDHNPENYRGYAVRWDQLRPDAQAFLIHHGLTNEEGKIA
jgi:hypothetical protein